MKINLTKTLDQLRIETWVASRLVSGEPLKADPQANGVLGEYDRNFNLWLEETRGKT